MNKIVCASDGADVTLTITPTETGYITASKCTKCGGSATVEVPLISPRVVVEKLEAGKVPKGVEEVKEVAVEDLKPTEVKPADVKKGRKGKVE
jgi:hypothetical protein